MVPDSAAQADPPGQPGPSSMSDATQPGAAAARPSCPGPAAAAGPDAAAAAPVAPGRQLAPLERRGSLEVLRDGLARLLQRGASIAGAEAGTSAKPARLPSWTGERAAQTAVSRRHSLSELMGLRPAAAVDGAPGSSASAVAGPAQPARRPRRNSLEDLRQAVASGIDAVFRSNASMSRVSTTVKRKGGLAAMPSIKTRFDSLDDFVQPLYNLRRSNHVTTLIATAKGSFEKVLVHQYLREQMTADMEHKVKKEVELLDSITHKVVAKCLGFWETPTHLYVVQQYGVRKEVFSDVVNGRGKLSERWTAAAVVAPLLDLLAHLAEEQIVHRNLRPEHLAFDKDLQLKLYSWGDAVWLASGAKAAGPVGVIDYMAPEMLQDAAEAAPSRQGSGTQQDLTVWPVHGADVEAPAEPPPAPTSQPASYDCRVDIWALGVLVYETLTGVGPWEVDNPDLTAALILWGELDAWPPGMSPGAQQFVRSCLAKDPAQRATLAQLQESPWLRGHVAAHLHGLPEGEEWNSAAAGQGAAGSRGMLATLGMWFRPGKSAAVCPA